MFLFSRILLRDNGGKRVVLPTEYSRKNSPWKNPHIAAIGGLIPEARYGLDGPPGRKGGFENSLFHVGG
jgi:hypothetical protein